MKTRKWYILILINMFVMISVNAQKGSHNYQIDITSPDITIRNDHLKLGGKNFLNESFSVNSYYLMKNGSPFIPITGEFHFSRFPNRYWKESIQKMKAGGINTIATYVFWIMHEETEGKFIWSGDYNLRKFVELCKANNIDVIVRIGPFCHGEIRNGGLPDWLLGKPLIIRSNDPVYLSYVERLYKQIGLQLEGLMFKDGGPVIGIQLENEFQHSAAPWGLTYPGQDYDWTSAEQDRAVTQAGVGSASEENPYSELGNEHMRILKTLAMKAGLDVPIYTATGWGNAAVIENESIPVTGGYPYPTWAEKELSPLYLYKNLQSDPDYQPVRYNPQDYPYISAEIGGGIMVRYNRRPTIPPQCLDALINRFLGSGTNGIGYYMYHGGSTPRGSLNYFTDEAYGYPKISYDFQAPIGEYGQLRPSFNRLKVIHHFIESFGSELATMGVVLAEKPVTEPDNIKDLRYSVRKKGNTGYIFMHNYQDHLKTSDIQNISFSITAGDGKFRIPESGGINLLAEQNLIIPFNLEIIGLKLQYATAQPLMRFNNRDVQYIVFYSADGIQPEFSLVKKKGFIINGTSCEILENDYRWLIKAEPDIPAEFTIGKSDGSLVKVLIVNREMAEQSWVINTDGNTVAAFSAATITDDNGILKILQEDNPTFGVRLYPADEYNILSSEHVAIDRQGLFTQFQSGVQHYSTELESEQISPNKYTVNLPGDIPDHINELLLRIYYTGDTGMGFLNGELVADDFYRGAAWEIGIRKILKSKIDQELVLYFRPIKSDAEYLHDFEADLLPDFSENNSLLEIKMIQFIPVYQLLVKIDN